MWGGGGRLAEIYLSTSNTYRADGTKLRKIHTYKDSIVTNFIARTETDYLDGFQYEKSITYSYSGNPELKFVPTSEGYFDFTKNKYIYNCSDHLGNTRLSYFHNGSSIEVLEENNYYPFGLRHEGYNALAGNPSYQYKYNGKELQETGMYDYGARFYMPDIGRWGVIDPLAEVYRRHSTYNYTVNNPIRFIDPDGRSVQTFSGQDAQNAYWQFYFSGSVSSVKGGSSFGSSGEGDSPMVYNDEGGAMIMSTALSSDGQGGGSSLSPWMQNYIDGNDFTQFETDIPFQKDQKQKDKWDLDDNGKMSLEEANTWYRNGNGKAVTLYANMLDLNFINTEGWIKGKTYSVQTLIKSNDGRVLGNITVKYLGNNKVSILPDTYNFEQHGKFMDSPFRNSATVLGNWLAGDGKEFQINFKGINKIRPGWHTGRHKL